MPGSNCTIIGCNISRKHKLALFQIPTKDDEYSTLWRNKLVAIITRDRVTDAGLKEQIEKRKLYFCERHYTEAQINRREYTIISCLLLCRVYYFAWSASQLKKKKKMGKKTFKQAIPFLIKKWVWKYNSKNSVTPQRFYICFRQHH